MAKDPYEYFRIEAQEILQGLGRGVLQLEKGVTPDLASRLLRLAHTIKGAARVVRQTEIAEHAHAIEDALAPLREPGSRVSSERIDDVLRLLDAMSARVAALDPPRSETVDAAPQGVSIEETQPAARVEQTDMDTLLDGIAEASVHLGGLRRIGAVAGRARQLIEVLSLRLGSPRGAEGPETLSGAEQQRLRALADELRTLVASVEPGLASGLDQAERHLQQVRDAAERLRLLPAHTLFAALERTARDVARALAKQVTFHTQGGEVRIDAHVIGIVQAALVQLVRNAVAHGIESPSQRARAGKTAAGRIEIEVVQRSHRIAFICRDDGAGIDLAAVRRLAVAKGLIAPSDAADDSDALFQLLLKGGISTVGKPTESAGRGVGLDVAREAAAQLAGEITMRTTAGAGTRIELAVPISLSSVDGLLVEAGGGRAAIPIPAVRQVLRLDGAAIAQAPTGSSIVHDGQVIPFVALAAVLKRSQNRSNHASLQGQPDHHTVVVIGAGEGLAAIGVERSLGVINVVVRPLPPLAPADPVVAGVSFDADGTPQVFLDPAGLVAAARHAGGRPQGASRRAKPPVLVIDDSLTTRMLEQSILESAGFEVDLATSAEEGWDMARRRAYRLFLVDVEMPGMDGFEFVEKTRADPVFREIPAILVTSRNADEDRQRGAAVGAHAYVVKGDFNQGHLLDIIRKLIE